MASRLDESEACRCQSDPPIQQQTVPCALDHEVLLRKDNDREAEEAP